jgi:hypothetical protein
MKIQTHMPRRLWGVHVDLIARAGAVEAIPILKEQFLRVQDLLVKAKIAAALVRLGDKDGAYWTFLVKLATPALESDAPDFIAYDSHGKASSIAGVCSVGKDT